MDLPRITVTGRVAVPDGVATGATIVFRLSGPDIDGPFGVVVPAAAQAAVVDGAFTVLLWPNSRGINQTKYAVAVHYPPTSGVRPETASYGAIAFDETLPVVDLNDLLLDASAPPDPVVVTRAEWGALFLTALGTYASVAAGLGAVADDAYFLTASAGGRVALLWRKVDGAAVEVQFEAELVE